MDTNHTTRLQLPMLLNRHKETNVQLTEILNESDSLVRCLILSQMDHLFSAASNFHEALIIELDIQIGILLPQAVMKLQHVHLTVIFLSKHNSYGKFSSIIYLLKENLSFMFIAR